MKKMYLFCFLMASLFSYAQAPPVISCDSEPETTGGFSMFTTPVVPDPSEIFVINVFIHVITDDNGNINEYQGNANVPNFYDEEEMMEVMYVLNKNFGGHNIFFKYRGYDIIADSDLTNDVTSNFGDYDIPGNFNLFFVNSLGGASGSAIPGNINSKYTFLGLAQAFDYLLTHEIGHCLNLWHTHQVSGSYSCEHVTRDINDPNYNADVSGDQVEDTAATPGPFGASYWNNCVFQNVGNQDDCIGTLYADVELNYMGYDMPSSTCNRVLTEGQFLRARTFLNNVTASHYLACFTTVEELYEPYFAEYVFGEVTSTYDYFDHIKVCRELIMEYRYQKGFNYAFVDNSNLPSDLDPEDWPIVYPEGDEDFGVIIEELGNKPTDNTSVATSTGNCEPEEVVSGMLYSMKFIGGPLDEIRPLTETEIEDQYFYSTLPSGTYFVITKTTTSGAVHSVTVYVP